MHGTHSNAALSAFPPSSSTIGCSGATIASFYLSITSHINILAEAAMLARSIKRGWGAQLSVDRQGPERLRCAYLVRLVSKTRPVDQIARRYRPARSRRVLHA